MAGYKRRGRGRESRSRSRHPLRKTRRTGHSRSRRRGARPRGHGLSVLSRRPLKRRRRLEEEEPEEELDDLGELNEPVENPQF